MIWKKADPPWKDLPVSVKSNSALMETTDGKFRFVGWLGKVLANDKAEGLTPRAVEFWLGADFNNGRPVAIARGNLNLGDQNIVFPMDWDINSFKCLIKVLKDKDLLEETSRYIGEINLFFGGKPTDIPTPGNSL